MTPAVAMPPDDRYPPPVSGGFGTAGDENSTGAGAESRLGVQAPRTGPGAGYVMVTLIEQYHEAQRRAKHVREAYTRAAGLDSPQNDKHRIECAFVELAKVDWHPAVLRFHASHGYYGSSSCSSDITENVGRYVALAITEQGKAIMKRAAELAEADAEKARLVAANEARAVLEGVSPG